MSDVPDIAQIEKHRFVYFSKSTGIAIDPEADSCMVFQKDSGVWTFDLLTLGDIRSVSEIISTYQVELNGSIGDGVRDQLGLSKAKRETGLKIELRSIKLPEVFLSLPQEKDRKRVYEAIYQVREGRLAEPGFKQLPSGVRQELTSGALTVDGDPARRFVPKAKGAPETEHGLSNKTMMIILGVIAVVGYITYEIMVPNTLLW